MDLGGALGGGGSVALAVNLRLDESVHAFERPRQSQGLLKCIAVAPLNLNSHPPPPPTSFSLRP